MLQTVGLVVLVVVGIYATHKLTVWIDRLQYPSAPGRVTHVSVVQGLDWSYLTAEGEIDDGTPVEPGQSLTVYHPCTGHKVRLRVTSLSVSYERSRTEWPVLERGDLGPPEVVVPPTVVQWTAVQERKLKQEATAGVPARRQRGRGQ